MLYLALSCLQGRTMQSAAEDLLEIGANNLQLTPGNVPTPGFNKWLQERRVSIRKHHGFHWEALRRKVWSETADCLVDADSVHPPQTNAGIADVWKQQAEQGNYAGILLETPDLSAASKAYEDYPVDPVNLPGFEYTGEIYDVWFSVGEQVQYEEEFLYWDDNGIAIPAFAAFCKEGCHQDMEMAEAYTPYAILRRNGDEVDIEIVGQMYRPWLDGIKPEEWDE